MQWWQSVERALENIGGTGSLNEIYAEVRIVRDHEGDSLPESLDAVVRKELEYNSSDSSNWNGRRDLFFSVHGIGNGVWGLRSTLQQAPVAVDISDVEPERTETVTYRIVRDTAMTRKIKAMHHHRCQICGHWIELPNGERYAEAHHIIPLGHPHNGPDSPSNIVVVCPNHHAMLDYGCMELEGKSLTVAADHRISPDSIQYHNRIVCRAETSVKAT